MGHWSTPIDPWPMWLIRFSWPIWPMTHDPSTHSLLWYRVLYVFLVCSEQTSSATAEIARDAWNSHSRSPKAICVPIDAAYNDFQLAPNSNLTSSFNRTWYYHAYFCTFIPHLSCRWNWKKTAGNRWSCFAVRVPRRLDYPTINLNPRLHAPYDHNTRVPDAQTDGRTSWQWRDDSF